MDDLIVSLQIEEDNCKSEKRSNKNSYEAKANMIEDLKEKSVDFQRPEAEKTCPGVQR